MNPGRGWNAPLFWLATGCFLCAVGTALFSFLVHGSIMLAVAMRRPELGFHVVWGVTMAVPLVAFTLLFGGAWRRVPRALQRLCATPAMRIGLLVTGAVVVTAWRGAFESSFLDRVTKAWSVDTEVLNNAYDAARDAATTLGVVAPLGIAALLLGLRASRDPDRDRDVVDVPVWLAAGCLTAIVSQELGMVVWSGALIVLGFLRAGSSAIEVLVWLVTLATPIACLVIAQAVPRRLLRPRLLGGALLILAVPAVCGFLALSALHAGAIHLLGNALYDHAEESRALASVVAAAIVPVAVGAVMLSALRALVSCESHDLRMCPRVLAEPALRSNP